MTTEQKLDAAAQLDAEAQIRKAMDASITSIDTHSHLIDAGMDFDKPWRIGQEIFTGKRFPQDRNIVNDVCSILERTGHPEPDAWTKNEYIQYALGIPPEGQLFMVNRYWRLVLGEMQYDTFLQRRALIDVVASYSDYLRGFEVAVAPYIVPPAPVAAVEPVAPEAEVQASSGMDSLESIQE